MNKLRSLIFVLIGLLLMTSISFAAENQIEITGTAYGTNSHLLHFDFSTATRPTGTADDSRFDAPSFYAGATKQFYIPISDPDFTGPGDSNITVGISTLTDDCDADGCLLKGYLWSDVVGWIVFDGDVINSSITDPNDGVPGDVYTPNMYPRIKDTGSITGFAWNEKIGWIGLSANTATGTIQPAASQTKDIWGVWLDTSADLEVNDMGTPADSSDDILLGRPFHGFAWSDNLGWIKFGKEDTDTFDFDFGAMTTWVPDDTPPNILSPSTVWFATGVNTGYVPPADEKTIVWNNFIADQESGIKSTSEGSEISLESTDLICQAYIPLAKNVILSTSADTNFKVGTLTMPLIGWLGQDGNIPPSGFCKYKLTAKILNGVNLPLYIGDTYIPPCLDYVTEPACSANTACNWTGTCEHKVDPIIAPDTDPNGVIIYVRAGNLDLSESEISFLEKTNNLPPSSSSAPPNTSAIADGKDFVGYSVALRDIAGNPIVDIACGSGDEATNPQFEYADCPERDVTLNANIVNQLRYDLTQPPNPDFDPTPALYSDANVYATGTPLFKSDDEVSDGVKDGIVKLEVNQPPNNNFNLTYQIEIASYAPSSTYSQASDYGAEVFSGLKIGTPEVQGFVYKIDDDSLPATNLIESPPDSGIFIPDPASVTSAKIDEGGLEHGECGFTSIYFKFFPPITTSNGTLESGGVDDVLTLSVPANVTFDINNFSENSIAQIGNGGLSIDNVFQYYSPSWSSTLAVMETQRISPSSDPDGEFAWTDPFQACSYCTRYEWYDGEYPAISGLEAQDAQDSVFHAFFQQFNPVIAPSIEQAKFLFDVEPPAYIESTISSDGTYEIIGRENIPYGHPPINPEGDLNDKDNYDEQGIIDRSDPVDLELNATSDPDDPLNNPDSITKDLSFTPEKFIPITIDDIDLRLIHEIGYRFEKQPFFSVYAQTPLLSNISVKDIGVEAIGPVAGEKLVTGRKFDIVSTTSTRQLQEQIRRNVAELTSSIDSPCSANTTITAFPVSGACVTHDTVNDTMFVYYEGTAGEKLIIEDTADIIAPNLPYTLIVKGGADVLIKSNIAYDSSEPLSSLGIIVIAENIGKGANVYMSHVPTNMAGTLYTEGSLLSGAPNELYYGDGSGLIQNLNNQLYWQGSIASRNTIAGAGTEPPKIPEGVKCFDKDTALSCAQRYDFDYFRRFTAVVKVAPETGSFIASDGLFSGGGNCPDGLCALGPDLPTTVVLSGDQINEAESELAPFFIEKDPRTLSLPPPGFSISGGFESIQEIR